MTAGENTAAVTPRDAATVVLLRRRGAETTVLMGQRAGRASFMPNKVVFPGGALDADDRTLRPQVGPPAACAARLAKSSDPSLATPLALTAIRETFEETGLRIGRPGPPPDGTEPGSIWARFGATPALDRLRFFFRAVTPPSLPKRFDARFFLTSADAVMDDLDDFSAADAELSYLEWLPLAEARRRELPFITEVVLAEIEAMIANGVDPTTPHAAAHFDARPAPFFRHDDDGAHFEAL